MIDQMAQQLWDMPSVDEFYDGLLRGKTFPEQVELINIRTRVPLKDYLLLKIKYGIGNPIIMTHNKENGRWVTSDIRDFESYVRWDKKYFQSKVVIGKLYENKNIQ